jgi:hypothetical protein
VVGFMKYLSISVQSLSRHRQETIPKNSKPVENAETAKYALLVRNSKVYSNPRKTLSIHSIVVQSPLLKRLLQKVLKDYPGLSLNLRRLEFTGKFEAIIHRWGRLQEAIAKLDDSSEDNRETKKHAELLFSVLKTEFSDVIDNSQDMMSKGVITFEHLWTIFQPASLVYTRQDGQDTAMKLVSTKYGIDRYVVVLYTLLKRLTHGQQQRYSGPLGHWEIHRLGWLEVWNK